MTNLCQAGSPAPSFYELGLDLQTIDLGVLYKLQNGKQLGLMAKHIIDTQESKYTSHDRPEGADFKLPAQVTIGASGIFNGYRLSIDNEIIIGKYGGSNIKKARFWILRAGAEKKFYSHYFVRGGLIAPLIAWTSTLGNVQGDIPWPKVGGTIGGGFKLGQLTIDGALSGDHGRSYVEKSIYLKAVLSSTLSF